MSFAHAVFIDHVFISSDSKDRVAASRIPPAKLLSTSFPEFKQVKEDPAMIELLSSQENTGTLEDYFGFRETPFGVTPDPRFFYSNPLYLEGLAALVYGIKAKKGLMLLTGEVGTGKTILLRKLMRQLDSGEIGRASCRERV